MVNKKLPKIGVAIATFNSATVIGACLGALRGLPAKVVLYDDGSTDDTVNIARAFRPDIVVLRGSGNDWWAGGTRVAVEHCFDSGCDYAVMLNPDVRLSPNAVGQLVSYVRQHPRTIAAALVVSDVNESQIAWAGSRFGKIHPWLPIYAHRYIKKRGEPAESVGSLPYSTDEVHGRGVVISREVYECIGILDSDSFPHYGADNDYSYRARAAGVDLIIVPTVRALLVTHSTGMQNLNSQPIADRLRGCRDYLIRRKNGEALRVNWALFWRYVPLHAVVPSYIFHITLNLIRRLI